MTRLVDNILKPNRLFGIFIAAVLLRLIALSVIGFHPEPFEYEDIANNILAHGQYFRVHLGTIYHSQAAPLYAFICAGIYAITDKSQIALIVFQVICSALIPLVIFKIGRQLEFSERICTLGAVISVVHPGLIVYSVAKLHPLNLDVLFISLSVLLVLKLSAGGNYRDFIFTGIVIGLGILTRSTIGFFALAAIIWLYIVGRKKLISGIFIKVVLISCGIVLVVLPWTIRNTLVHKRFVPVSNAAAEVFWRGNNPVASGTTYLKDGRTVFEAAPEEFRKEIYRSNELGQRDLFLKDARSFISAHPVLFLKRTLKKWILFWWFSPTTGGAYPQAWFYFYLVFYVPLLAFFLLGFFRSYKLSNKGIRSKLNLVALMFLSISISQSLFYVDTRHRWGVESLMGLFAAYGLAAVLGGRLRKNDK